MAKKKIERDVTEDPRYHDTWRLLKKYRDVVWSMELSVQQVRKTFQIEFGSSIEDFLESIYLAGVDLGGTEIENHARCIERSNKMLTLLKNAVDMLRVKHKHGEVYYWHDKIPYDIARATTLTTGTYSARLNYRILYKTNYSSSYQVLASNLLTSNDYSFSLNAIPVQAGEVVTDVYFDFGKVPVGFQSIQNPTLSVVVNGNAANGYQMINRADVGGKYQGTWQTAQASWVTIIQKLWNTPDLPKTGY